jgi:hypothetical protein
MFVFVCLSLVRVCIKLPSIEICSSLMIFYLGEKNEITMYDVGMQSMGPN